MELLTEREAAKLIQMSSSWLKLYRRAGKIKYYRLGNSIRYDRKEIMELLSNSLVLPKV
jgi:predicted site-specific integrase-resolvase